MGAEQQLPGRQLLDKGLSFGRWLYNVFDKMGRIPEGLFRKSDYFNIPYELVFFAAY